MLWLEGLAWAFLGTGSGVGIASISYVVKTRGWSYFARLKLVGRKPARKSLSLEVRAELGSDMGMAEWDEEFRKLCVPRRDPGLVAHVEAGGSPLAYGWSVEKELASMHDAVKAAMTVEKKRAAQTSTVGDYCADCEYVEVATFASQYVKRHKTCLCDGCLEVERQQAARGMINNMGLIHA